jgi:hypothetical protein
MLYLSVYSLGVTVALLGRRFLSRITWASKPGGAFQRTVAVLFVVVGLLVVTGLDQTLQTKLSTADPGSREPCGFGPACAPPPGMPQRAGRFLGGSR